MRGTLPPVSGVALLCALSLGTPNAPVAAQQVQAPSARVVARPPAPVFAPEVRAARSVSATHWGNLTITDPHLVSVMRRMSDRSPSFRQALDGLAAARIPVLVGTPAELIDLLPPPVRSRSLLARAVPIPARLPERRLRLPGAPRLPLRQVIVVVDVPAIRDLYGIQGVLPALEADLAIILAHELAGHALDWARSGDLYDACLDPSTVVLALDPGAKGCAVERENQVRRDLGLVERSAYLELPLSSGQSLLDLERVHLLHRSGLALSQLIGSTGRRLQPPAASLHRDTD